LLIRFFSTDIVLLVPLHEITHPHFHGSTRRVPHITDEIVHIGAGGGNVSRLDGEKILPGFFAKAFFDYLDKSKQFHRLVVADIVEPVRCHTRPGIKN